MGTQALSVCRGQEGASRCPAPRSKPSRSKATHSKAPRSKPPRSKAAHKEPSHALPGRCSPCSPPKAPLNPAGFPRESRLCDARKQTEHFPQPAQLQVIFLL